MLTITDSAAEALDTIVASTPDAPNTAGLRISPTAEQDGAPGFALSLAAEPAPDDQVVDVEGHETPIYVAAEAAPELDDKVLDAQVQGDQVGFMLLQR
jgi:iron-sulfur cluster assembly protein